ncbi:MAG: hypothetical protein FJZ67_03230 [Bacteroidetes bacterium]|nr:hypothetical protein [Bacteroidota bacterium]
MIFPNRENINRWLFDYTEGNLSVDQETMLENFILNNPDIEVDLDAWNGSKLVSEDIRLPNKEKLKRKRRIAPFLVSSTVFLLIISSAILMVNPSSVEKDKVVSNFKKGKQEVNSKDGNTKVFTNSSFGANPSDSYINDSNNIEEDKTNNFKNLYFIGTPSKSVVSSNNHLQSYNHTENDENLFNDLTSEHNTSYATINQINSTEINSTFNSGFSRLSLRKVDLKSMKLDYYQLEEVDETENETENKQFDINLNLGKVKLFQKIEKVLDNDLGLSNIPDHTYAIPEYSNVDVLFSNIGATSQFRFQSTTTGRWIEDLDQRKFSQQITMDGYSRGAQSGFGLQANYDYFANGSIQNWNTCLLFSPKIALSRSISFEPALRFKLGNKILNEDRIENQSLVNFESQTTNQFNFDSTIAIGSKLWYRDLDLGFTINTPYFYLGGQVSNVLRHQNNIYSNYENLETRAQNVYNAIIGTQYISRNQQIQFSPYCFFEHINSNRFFAGFSLKLYKVMLGGSYGTGNISSGTLGLSFKNFALFAQSSYGYAQAISKNSFTHQLTIRFNSNIDKKSRRYITL